ncbi:hypothetical protein HDU76_006702, partial [Blyttiomyces sp. JEL0837]
TTPGTTYVPTQTTNKYNTTPTADCEEEEEYDDEDCEEETTTVQEDCEETPVPTPTPDCEDDTTYVPVPTSAVAKTTPVSYAYVPQYQTSTVVAAQVPVKNNTGNIQYSAAVATKGSYVVGLAAAAAIAGLFL